MNSFDLTNFLSMMGIASVPLRNDVQFALELNMVKLRYLSPRCIKCGISVNVPNVEIGADEVCQMCRDHPQQTELVSSMSDLGEIKVQRCVLLYSGGKDSTYALKLLVEKYGAEVHAVTFDNGFIADQAKKNIERVCAALKVKHSYVTVPEVEQIYNDSIDSNFGADTIRYSTNACGSCISLVMALGVIEAVAWGADFICGGWTPGQMTDYHVAPYTFVSGVVDRHLARLVDLRPRKYSFMRHYIGAHSKKGPMLFNPLYLEHYDEDCIKKDIAGIGWHAPDGLDSCSTNCMLNGYLVLEHVAKYGFHPYEFELAGHVRRNLLSIDEFEEKISRVSVAQTAIEHVAIRLQRTLGRRSDNA